MAVKVTFNTITKRIICNNSVTELDAKVDVYSDAKEDWNSGSLDINGIRLNKFKFPFRAIGGDDTAPGEKAPLYLYLKYGWRIRPFEGDHILNIINGAILVNENTTFDPFVITLGAFNVHVRFYVPIKATIVTSDTDLTFIKDVEGGKWNVTTEDGGTMVISKADNTTEVCRFALYDINGQRTSKQEEAVRRDRIL